MVNSEGVVSPLTGTISIPVGITNKANWSTMTVALKPGERLFLFTDGLTEAVGASGEHYGEERLSQNLQALANACRFWLRRSSP